MNDRSLHPTSIAAAALVIGGALVLAMPQHAMSILRLVVVTIAAGAALHALAIHSPPAWWRSPFDRASPWRRGPEGPGDVAWIRAVLSGRRQRIPGAPPLPPGVLRLLQPLIRGTLERAGHDAHDPASGSLRGQVSALTIAILSAEPLRRTTWLTTVWPSGRATAAVVHHVLDDLERLSEDAGAALHTPIPMPPRGQ